MKGEVLSRIYFLLPKYREAITKWVPEEFSDKLTAELFLAHLYNETRCDPLFTSTQKKYGLLGIRHDRWIDIWENVLGESYKDVFDVDAHIELHVKYFSRLYDRFKKLEHVLRAYYWNPQIIEYCIGKKCDFSRLESFIVYAMEWDIVTRPEKKRIDRKAFVDTWIYPSQIWRYLKMLELSTKKVDSTKERWNELIRRNANEETDTADGAYRIFAVGDDG